MKINDNHKERNCPTHMQSRMVHKSLVNFRNGTKDKMTDLFWLWILLLLFKMLDPKQQFISFSAQLVNFTF